MSSYSQGQYGWEGQGFTYNMEAPSDFGAPQDFGSFEYSAQSQSASPYYESAPYRGTILTPQVPGLPGSEPADSEDYDSEPPLLEELGINFDHIMQKTLAVVNPFRRSDPTVLLDADLAGPLVFCLAFGGFLLLGGKVHFGYIYGIGVLGCLSIYALLNLMSEDGVTVGVTVSVLGYCLLPMVTLSGISVLWSLKGTLGNVLAVAAILWCAQSASKQFVTALAMDHQQPLVAYPCALLYGVFALLTVF